MAMNKIEFINDITPLSAETFNTMQDNIENGINEHLSFVDNQTLTDEQKEIAHRNLGIGNLEAITALLETDTQTGSSLSVNASNYNALEFKIDGKCEQNGTPTPDASAEVKTMPSIRNLCDGINQNYYLNNTGNLAGLVTGNSGLVISTNGKTTFTISTNIVQERYRVACINKLLQEEKSTTTAYNGVNKDGTNESITIDTTGYSYLIVNATDLNEIMIEESSVAHDFVPYGSYAKVKITNEDITKEVLIDLQDNELCSIGDVKDTLNIVNGKAILTKNIGKIILNGSENWDVMKTSAGVEFRYLNNLIKLNIDDNTIANIISDKFTATTPGIMWTNVINAITVANTSARLLVSLQDTSITTVDAFKTWLSQNNVTVYYELATPETIELGTIDIPLYAGINNITLVDDLETELYIKYYKKFNQDSANKYSTEERVIGTWINGKPLYRKTYVANVPSSIGGVQTVDINLSSISNIEMIYANTGASFLLYSGGSSHHLGYYDYPNVKMNNYFREFPNGIGDYRIDFTGLNAGTMYITFEYTKTTD